MAKFLTTELLLLHRLIFNKSNEADEVDFFTDVEKLSLGTAKINI